MEHLLKQHGVTPEEAEEVFYTDPYFRRGRDGTRYVYGQTETGRYLFVVYLDLGSSTVRVISARDMTPREKRLYLRR
ncbi:BrnT family toxin [Candidatus Poribacteria bacterium]|nr:BrnT family toxin [Candidatus Poribacteria bacterium]